MAWEFNRDYKDLAQVAPFYPDYLEIYAELTTAAEYPYNDSFRGRIPGIAGPGEDTAIYLLQKTRDLHRMQIQVAARREDGWRDLDPAEVSEGQPCRFAAVAEYGWYMGGDGFREWRNARLGRTGSSVVVLTGRRRVNGVIVSGRLLVLDAPLA